MATYVNTVSGKQLLVQIGDGGSPVEQFTHDCLINTERGINFSSNPTTEVLPRCDEPTEPGWTEVTVDELSSTIEGAGKLHTPSIAFWYEWYISGSAKNVRVRTNDVAAVNGGGYWQGAYKLTSFQVTGPDKGSSTVATTLQSNGEVVWVPFT